MEKLEQKILKSIIENLEESSESGWDEGDLEDYYKYASKMRITINSSINILKQMIDEDKNND